MPRPQFSIRTLLWLTLVVAAFLGGILFEKQRAKQIQPKEDASPFDDLFLDPPPRSPSTQGPDFFSPAPQE